MGQYFRPCALTNDKKSLTAVFDYCGKLGTADTVLINTIYNFLKKTPSRFVWAGDYAKPRNLSLPEELIAIRYANDFADPIDRDAIIKSIERKKVTLYEYANYVNRIFSIIIPTRKYPLVTDTYRYLVNLDKNEYVDLWFQEYQNSVGVDLVLQFLCADGGEKGINGCFDGCPYTGPDKELIGTWAYDTITISNSTPNESIPINPRFINFGSLLQMLDTISMWLDNVDDMSDDMSENFIQRINEITTRIGEKFKNNRLI